MEFARALSSLPRIFLGATKQIGDREVIITELPLENAVNAGVSIRRLGVGLVPIFETETVRLEHRISLNDWAEMSETERALLIARRRIAIQMQNLQTEAEIRKAKQEAKKK